MSLSTSEISFSSEDSRPFNSRFCRYDGGFDPFNVEGPATALLLGSTLPVLNSSREIFRTSPNCKYHVIFAIAMNSPTELTASSSEPSSSPAANRSACRLIAFTIIAQFCMHKQLRRAVPHEVLIVEVSL